MKAVRRVDDLAVPLGHWLADVMVGVTAAKSVDGWVATTGAEQVVWKAEWKADLKAAMTADRKVVLMVDPEAGRLAGH